MQVERKYEQYTAVFIKFMLEMILEALKNVDVKQRSFSIHPSSEERLFALLREDPRMTIPLIAQQPGLGERQVCHLSASLKEKGKIKREGSNNFSYWIVISMS